MSTRPKVLAGARVGVLARLIANGFAQAVAMVATALLVKQFFDVFMVSPPVNEMAALWGYGAALAAAALAIAGLRMIERIDAERMGQSYTHQMRVELFGHMSRLTPRVLQQRSRGAVMLRFVGDLTALKLWVSQGVARLTVAGVTSVGTLVALAFVSVPLAIVVGAALVVGAAVIMALGRWLERCVRDVRRRRTRLAANVTEKIGALGSIQAYGQVAREQRRVRRQSRQQASAMITRATAIGAMRGVIELTAGLATVGALVMGVLLVGSGQGTAGTVVAAMSIVGLLTPALRDLGRVQEYWHGAVVSWEKIDDFLALPATATDAPGAVALAPVAGEVTFASVTVSGALREFSAVAKAGEIVALVGPNGAGKSTVLTVAARLMAPEQGRVLLDHQDIAEVTMRSLRQAVSLVTPDLPLLRGSVNRNLRYRQPDASEDEVAQIRALCGIDEVLAELPRGDKTRIREDGVNLSLGQRQRLALGRGILGMPSVLLLDELDANLDPSAAAALRRVLAEYPGTVLMVTHRLDWAAMADTIWHLRAGRLVEAGAPAQLLDGDGPTAELFHRPRAVASGG